ncbi:MAG: hypothetical protein J3R72DRAFT_501484 [Linnemannia gamsii]|nr:MAG: hypothetical protein J3R72DRAFT_501484 [Linnemannia gamsii]
MLEELQIDTPVQCYSNSKKVSYTPKLTIRLEGGLCLVGRLRYVQRLRVHANGLPLEPAPFGEEELNWMVSSGQESSKFGKKQQERAQLWQQQRFREERLEALRLKKQQEQEQKREEAVVVSRLSDTNGPLDAEALLMDQLKSLGMLKEVDEIIRGIGLRSLLPLPCLEGLSLDHPYFVCPEDEIRHCVTPRINKSRS